jgi:hypothetical protein
MRHEHDAPPRITLGTMAGGIACAAALYAWLWFMALVEAALFP